MALLKLSRVYEAFWGPWRSLAFLPFGALTFSVRPGRDRENTVSISVHPGRGCGEDTFFLLRIVAQKMHVLAYFVVIVAQAVSAKTLLASRMVVTLVCFAI